MQRWGGRAECCGWLAKVGDSRSECAVCCLLTAVQLQSGGNDADLGRAGVTLDYSILS